MHPTVRQLFDATRLPGEEPLKSALVAFFLGHVPRFTSQLHLDDLDDLDDLEVVRVRSDGGDRLTVSGSIWLIRGDPFAFWLDLVRDPAPGITARWLLYCQLDARTRAGKVAALDPSSIEHPEALGRRVFVSNAEIAEDAQVR